MRIHLYAAAAALFLPFAANAATMICAPISEAQVDGFFGTWNQAIATGTPGDVAALYADDAVLLPTLSNTVRYTNAARIDYFAHFMAKKPHGTIEEGKIALGCNMAIDSGVYRFDFGDGSHVLARYTFAYAYHGGKWRIASHHSSLMPEAASAAKAH